jgi:hypothetical protein
MQPTLAARDPRYPIGRWDRQAVAADGLAAAIEQLAALPGALRAAVDGLDDAQLDTPYRPEGWTVRQLVHHIADSHLNAYIRFRWTLTEEEPTIKTYEEKRWAELPDALAGPVAPSLAILGGLHERWVALLRGTGPAALARTLRHPEHGVLSLGQLLGLYAWHSRHHVAHVTTLRERMGW